MRPHRFSLRQLQYAAAVADLRSFRRAAEACYVSQPSLSAQIVALEDALGAPLFERSRRRVLVTSAGEELISRARRLLLEADDLGAAAQRLGDPLSGTLRLGVIPTISPYLLPEVVPVVHRRHAQLTVAWREDKTAALLESLARGALDGAILALEAELGDVEREVLGRDPFVLALPRGHPLAGKTSAVRVEELEGADMLLLEDGHCFRDQALSFCTRTGIREQELRATSLSTLAQMVASGNGITLLPQMAVAVENRASQLVVRRIAEPAPFRTIALVWRRRSPLAAALTELAGSLRQAFGARPGIGRRGAKPRR
jgi:LysR family hydrogen peroxide-inducible transcriptional activator